MPTLAPVLFVTHVPWEGPHRIARAFERFDAPALSRCPLAGDSLPAVESVSAAVFMGGPMNVDDIENFPALRSERSWIREAIDQDLPVLGVCLGSHLIARAAGASVSPGAAPELGWREITVHDRSDPVLGPLSPTSNVLHWHGDVFELPDGAELLASSAQTVNQAFRIRNAWGVLFHAEADNQLVETWLSEPSMAAEAEQVMGADYGQRLREGAGASTDLVERSDTAFENFARFALGV